MKILRAIWIILIATFITPLFAQDTNDAKEPRWKQLSLAYGFVVGQQASLELVENRFPDLGIETRKTWLAFNSTALGESVKGVEAELAKELGEKWPEYKKTTADQLSELIGKQELTRQQATDFLAEVKQRAKGNIPESIRSTLLSAHPGYAKNPGLEIADGWKQTFRTKDHLKAKGVDFSISFPTSWTKREGNRPNIIQVFQSGAGHGPITCSLMVKNIPLPVRHKPTEKELKEFFQPDELKNSVPDGGTFIEAKSIILEGSPAGMLVSDHTVQRLDISLSMRMTQFITIQGSSLISIQFAVARTPSLTESLDELQKQYLPTYRVIANTFVLNDKYK